MSIHIPAAVLEKKARIVAPPALRRNRQERTFDLHPAVHLMLAGAWMSFVVILSAAFMGPDLVIPLGINIIGVSALFVVPGLWARVRPDHGSRRPSWSEFMAEGVETNTGHLETKEALAQIFILPVLLLSLATVMVAIKLTL
jgi:hypothetical protein